MHTHKTAQAQHFEAADVVLGAIGAGLANLLFMRPSEEHVSKMPHVSNMFAANTIHVAMNVDDGKSRHFCDSENVEVLLRGVGTLRSILDPR